MESGGHLAAGVSVALQQVLARLRTEVPWVDRAPWEIIRDHFRLTMQAFDAPTAARRVERPSSTCAPTRFLAVRLGLSALQFAGDAVVPTASRRRFAEDGGRHNRSRHIRGSSSRRARSSYRRRCPPCRSR